MGGSQSTGRKFSRSFGENKQGESVVVRSTVRVPKAGSSAAGLEGEVLASSFGPGHTTLYENFNHGLSVSRNAPCLGTRSMTVSADKDGKQISTAGAFQWITYAQAEERILAFGSGLRGLGLKPGDKLGMYSKNRAEWVITEQACNAHSIISVPLYDTLGADAVSYIVNHAELSFVVCSREAMKNMLASLPSCPVLKFIIQYEDVSDEQRAAAALPEGVQLLSMSEVEAAGKRAPVEVSPPKPEDLCTIMYTSGTTGQPKGVMLTHSCFVSDAAGAIMGGISLFKDDRYLSYLPLAHVFERTVQVALFSVGAAVGFYQGDTLKLMDDIQELKPTIFASVPRLYNRIYDKINAAIREKGGLAATLFNMGFAAKKAQMEAGQMPSSWLYDTLVFSKVKARLGGHVRLMVTGSAPISRDVKQFMSICFCAPMMEGYGLTESSAAATLCSPDDPSVGHVGGPVACNEIKLMDVAEMGYTSLDQPCPRGEVCIRGENVFKGYYKEPEKTAEALDADGWFHTGDIGRINADGTVSIIDRKKNIFKLAQGEYVAAEALEGVYHKSKFVAQPFVYGDSLQAFLIAVVVPDFEVLIPFAKANGFENTDDLKALCADPKIKKLIMDDMTKVGKEAKLKGYEFIKDIHVEHELFSVENNLLTPTFKLKRPQLTTHYRSAIDAMYVGINAAEAAKMAQQKD